MNNNISAWSAVNLFLRSSYRIPAPENNLSDGTLVGREQKCYFASLTKRVYIPQLVISSSIWTISL